MSSINLSTSIAPDAASGDERIAPAVEAALQSRATAAAEKFEGFFIAEMLHQMRRSAQESGGEDGMFSRRSNMDMLDMADNVLAEGLAKQHAFGIADVLLRQLLPTLQGEFKSGEKTVALDK